MKYRVSAERFLYDDVKKREGEAGRFVAEWSRSLNEDLSFLAYCSPLGFRDNDGYSDVWHPWFIKSSFLFQYTHVSKSIFKAILRFFKILATNKTGSYLFVDRGECTSLGVAPTYLCSKAEKGSVYTNYFSNRDCENCSWALFDESGSNSLMNRVEFLINTISLSLSCFKLLSKKPSKDSWISWIVFIIMAQTWVIAGYWSTNFTLKLFLEKLFKNQKFNMVFCIHEFHPHSRVLWYLADKYKIESTSVSHALLAREKLWLHPTKEEREVGLSFPDNFIVNSSIDIEHLKDTYPKSTKIIKASSPRYSHWSEKRVVDLEPEKRVLFAGSLAWWDNEILLQTIKELVEDNSRSDYKLRIRFHPSSLYKRTWDKWIQGNSERVEVDKGDLKKSIEESSMVVGVGTTVLEEAPFFSRPSVTLTDEKFQTFFKNGIPYQVKSKDFSWETIDKIIQDHPKYLIDKRNLATKAFGLNEREYSLADNKYI